MRHTVISAEVLPDAGKSEPAALALQRLGFRVLHIGATISIEAPERLWRSVFKEAFVKRHRTLPENRMKGGDELDRELTIDRAELPADLEKYVSRVVLVRPPEFF